MKFNKYWERLVMVYVHKIEETDAGNVTIYIKKKNADLVGGLGGLQSGLIQRIGGTF